MCNCGNKRQSLNAGKQQSPIPASQNNNNNAMSFGMKMEFMPLMYSGKNIIVARGIFSGRRYRFLPDVKTIVEKRDASALLGIAGMYVSV